METPSQGLSNTLDVSYRLLFERIPMPVWVYDVKTLKILAANAAALARYGYSPQELPGLSWLDHHHPDDAAQVQERAKQPLDEPPSTQQGRHRHRNGDLFEVETIGSDLEFDGVSARMNVVREVTGQYRADTVQRALSQQLSSALENINDVFFSLDRQWRFTCVNARAEALFQRPRAELLGTTLWEILPGMHASVFEIEFVRAMSDGCAVCFDASYPGWTGIQKVQVFPSPQGLAVYLRQATEARVPKQRLEEGLETLSAVLNSTNDAIIGADLEGRILMFNPAAERIFRYTRASVMNQGLELLLPERFRAAHRQHRHHFAQSNESSRMMGLGLVKGRRSDGQEIEMEGSITRMHLEQQQIFLANLKNVTERMRGDAEVEHSREQLLELTHRLMQQEKTLVKRLAQVLHDQLGQTVAAIRMAHETIVALQKGQAPSPVARLQTQLGTLIGQAVRQVRQVLVDLRPPLLEEQGLSAALDNELRNRSLTHPQIDIAIHVEPETAQTRWPAEVEYAGFMVAREAVENALRHSGASSVSVRLTGSSHSLQLDVVDNGSGLVADTRQHSGHLGIRDMRERAHGVGATVTVDSGVSAAGTRVTFSWKSAP
jgi:hypothetical protein